MQKFKTLIITATFFFLFFNSVLFAQQNQSPVLLAIGNKIVNENVLLKFTLAATDPDGNSLTYQAVNLPLGATFNAATKVFSWTPTYSQSGSYPNVTFIVSDGVLSDSEIIVITVNNINRAPILDIVGAKTTDENQLIEFTVSGADPDGNALIYSATGLPAGSIFNPETKTFSWTPTYKQGRTSVYNIKFIVSDGTLTDYEYVPVTVNNINLPPILTVISDKTINENKLLKFTVSATDPDGTVLIYTAINLPSGATFTSSTRTFSWTPTYEQAGIYSNIVFMVSDGSLIDTESITITVTNKNRAPILDVIGPKTTDENQSITFTINGSDPDNNAVTYSATSLPTGAMFNAETRTFNWTPTYKQGRATVYNIKFIVSDGGLTDYEYVAVTVNNVNLPPVLTTIGNKTVNENVLLKFTLVATDPDASSLTYEVANLPPGATFTPSTRVFSWTPDYTQAGLYSNITISVNDGSLTDSKSFSITVTNVNAPPILDVIGNKTIEENQLLEFSVNATEADRSTIIYSVSGLPAGATFNSSTRIFSWIPNFSQAGMFSNIKFTVSDGGLTDYELITITVNNVNRPPVLNTIGSKIINENQLLEFTLNATDADNDILTYSIIHLPVGAVFNETTKTFSWTPTHEQVGNYSNIIFRVTDGQSTTEEQINITVQAVLFCGDGIVSSGEECDDGNQISGDGCSAQCVIEIPENNPPTIIVTAPEYCLDSADLSATATDDGYPNPPSLLTMQWSKISGPGNVIFDTPTELNSTVHFDAPGMYVLRLTANDGELSTFFDISFISGTAAAGTISENTLWTKAQSPYFITGDVTIPKGFILTIEPGVAVKVTGNYKIHTYGTLYAQGNASQRITFTSSKVNPAVGDWGGIYFYSGSNDNSIVDYLKIEYAQKGISIERTDLVITNTIIKNNQVGLYINEVTHAQLFYNEITNNTQYGVSCITGTNQKVANPTAHYNSIYGNGTYNWYNSFKEINQNHSATTINAENNWWGTFEPTQIAVGIWDKSDSSSRPKVDFEPYLTASYAITGNTVEQRFFDPKNKETATIRYNLEENALVTLKIFTYPARNLVRTLLDNQSRLSGVNSEIWDGKNNLLEELPSGVYVYTISAQTASGTFIYDSIIETILGPQPQNVSITPKDNFSPFTGERLNISYQLEFPALVSLKYADTPIFVDQVRDAGSNIEFWDGHDADGNIVVVSQGLVPIKIITKPLPENILCIEHKLSSDITTLFTDPYVIRPLYNEVTQIEYSINSLSTVSLKILSPDGSEILATLEQGIHKNSGTYTFLWDGRMENGEIIAEDGDYKVRVEAVNNLGNVVIRDGNIRILY